jgi:hypothetical protein
MHLTRKMNTRDAHGGSEYNVIMHGYIRSSEVLQWMQTKYHHNSNLLAK